MQLVQPFAFIHFDIFITNISQGNERKTKTQKKKILHNRKQQRKNNNKKIYKKRENEKTKKTHQTNFAAAIPCSFCSLFFFSYSSERSKATKILLFVIYDIILYVENWILFFILLYCSSNILLLADIQSTCECLHFFSRTIKNFSLIGNAKNKKQKLYNDKILNSVQRLMTCLRNFKTKRYWWHKTIMAITCSKLKISSPVFKQNRMQFDSVKIKKLMVFTLMNEVSVV